MMFIINLVTLKALAMLSLLFNKLASDLLELFVYLGVTKFIMMFIVSLVSPKGFSKVGALV
jgi:hypothetical protein